MSLSIRTTFADIFENPVVPRFSVIVNPGTFRESLASIVAHTIDGPIVRLSVTGEIGRVVRPALDDPIRNGQVNVLIEIAQVQPDRTIVFDDRHSVPGRAPIALFHQEV